MNDVPKLDYESLEKYTDAGHLPDCRFHSAPLDVCDCVHRRMLADIKRLSTEIEAAVLAERQACLALADEFAESGGDAENVFQAIRARTTQEGK